MSRGGVVPYSLTQDTAGPICRTVEDCARTLDVIQGQGKRIGVLSSFFGKERVNESVNRVMEDAKRVFEAGGATLIPIDDPIDSDWMIREVSVHLDDFRTHLDGYLEKLPPDAPVHSLGDVT